MTTDADLVSGIDVIIDTFSSVYSLKRGTAAARTLKGVITSIGNNDQQLVNAVGIEASIFYCKALSPPAKKFDRLTNSSGIVFVIESVHEYRVNDVVVAHKMVVKS